MSARTPGSVNQTPPGIGGVGYSGAGKELARACQRGACKIARTAAHTHVLDDALSDLELRLGDRFVRIHRNALVAVQAIRALELRGGAKDIDADGWAVRVAPLDEWLPVSRRQVAAVRAVLATGS